MTDLISLDQAAQLLKTGCRALVAGDAALLRQLPRGQWIGGSIPYFMARAGGVVERSKVFVTVLPDTVSDATIRAYSCSDVDQLPRDYPSYGCSFIILPSRSDVSQRFAFECLNWPGLLNSPLVGWNAGVLLSELKSTKPTVFDGTSLAEYDDAAVVMHASLDTKYVARVEIINPFQQGNGATITFPRAGFLVSNCTVAGEPWNFVDYLERVEADVRWPLVANYAGAQLNVSISGVDKENRQAFLYAPVLEGVEYRLAAPVSDLAGYFGKEFAARQIDPVFSCNCFLNYLYAGLEGKHTGNAVGPFTFGEIAYVQLNQTLVYVTFDPMSESA